ncbi:MAG: hypothetical protein ABIO36_10995 [Pyrinomonadaceae bacterium]
MKRIIDQKKIGVLLTLVMLFGVGAASAQRKPVLRKKHVVKKVYVKPVPVFTVATGTVLRARMNETISSKTARVGSTFNVTVTEPVYSTNGVVVIPTGSTLVGRVNSVKPAANGGKPGQIDASFISVRLPNGRSRAINGSLTELTGNTDSDNEGTATGKKMGNRKIIFIGGGGAGGAVLGAAIGGGKGALIGGLLGAGAGFLGDRYTKGKEAEVKSGTEFGVYLNQAIALPRFVEVNPVNP